MKSLKILPAFVLLLLIIISGCSEETKVENRTHIHLISELSKSEKPRINRVFEDSLIIKIPGTANVGYPEEKIFDIPEKSEYLGFNRVIPGISMIQQSVIEKLAGDSPVKSKEPVVVSYISGKNGKKVLHNINEATTVKLLSTIDVDRDSLPYYKRIAVRKGAIDIQNGDTVYPPVCVVAVYPKRIKALPFDYKENAFMDISILEANQELPGNFVRKIAKDINEVMWFQTHTGGLISYNGQFFDQYMGYGGLTSEAGLSMLIDKKGNIWTGSNGGGVYCFDGKKVTQYTTSQGLAGDKVLSIIEDKNGNIWFATSTGVSIFNGESFTSYNTKNGLALDYVYNIYEDRQGNIWMGTFGGGVTIFDGKSFTTYDEKDGLCLNHVLSITQDHNDNMWFGTFGGGVSVFNGTSFTNYSIEQGLGSSIIMAIIEDENNNLWFGTHGHGVTYFDGTAFSYFTTEEGLSDNYIRTIYEGSEGNLWIGTDGAGVSKINLNSFKHFTKQQGLIDNNITALYQDINGNMFLSPYNGGVLIFDKPKYPGHLGKYIHINKDLGLGNNIVVSIVQDINGDYWFSNYEEGVCKLDGVLLQSGKLKFSIYSDKTGLNNDVVRSVVQDRIGNLWFGTEGGVTKYDGVKFSTITQKNGLGSNVIMSIYEDMDGAIWFGTMDGGVSRLLNDTLTTFDVDSGLGNNTVWSIIQDKNGIMWFGTDGAGVTAYNGQYFRSFNTDNGLCNNAVYSLVIDNNNALWVGTVRGISQFKHLDSLSYDNNQFVNGNLEILNYGKLDGLLGLDFSHNSVLYDQLGCLWWGTDKALTMVDLTTFRSASKVPLVHVSGLLINNKAVDFNKMKHENMSNEGVRFTDVSPFLNNPSELSLPFDHNHITFQFAATDWSSPNQIQYRFKLFGLDEEWSLPTKENVADYRNIPPGNFIFIIQAKGKSGNWSEAFTFAFEIRSPWYFTWWSIMLYLVIFGLAIWGFVKWRVNIVQRQKLILEHMVAARTRDLDKALLLAEQATIAKSQFIATISHEIRTPLNAIMGLTHLAISHTLDPKLEDYLVKIDRSAITLLSLISEILDFSKIEAGKMQLEKVNFDLEVVISSVIVLNAQPAREKNLEFVININPNVPRMLIGDPLRIGQVITNLCNNAIKFTSSGEVIVSIDVEEEVSKDDIFIQVSVKDTGIGIHEEQFPLLFDAFKQADSSITRKYGGTGLGLSISKLFIEMMEGQIWMESKVGEGTTFFFDFKAGVQKEQPLKNQIIPEELKDCDILVCDSNPSALSSMKSILKSYSLNVITAQSGEEVLKLIAEKPYDLLLISIQLSGMSGLDTIVTIKASPSYPNLKTILITDSDTSKKSFENNISGVDGYLTKPVVSTFLMEKILSIFGMQSIVLQNKDKSDSQIEEIKKVLSGKRVLLAEDNDLNRQVVIELVSKIGITVDSANDGASALQKSIKQKYDLILMDLHMPVMDGFNATIQIRQHGLEIPIIAVTADAMDSIKERCEEIGISDIITKPINPGLLYKKLVQWIAPHVVLDNVKGKRKSELEFPDLARFELDTITGVNRFGNDKNLYVKMLKKFISSNETTCEEIKIMIKNNETNQAHIKVHSLKGESANIGADKVSELASEIEQQILKNELSGFEKNMISMEQAISNITSLFHLHLSNPDESKGVYNMPVKESIGELITCLNSKDPKVFDLIDGLITNGVSEQDLEPIIKAINNGNSEEAVSLLNDLMKINS
jgi:signal transduction histidine kinase/ligand-binding sensor domain-containing protein/DNA-binding response OmpR family regulator/HPt (histidine-containing phosphotransfer) domain-containing protein